MKRIVILTKSVFIVWQKPNPNPNKNITNNIRRNNLNETTYKKRWDPNRTFSCFAAIVIGAFLGCYLPMVVASLVHIYAGGTTNHSLTTTLEILLFLTFLNTVLNPMIYSLRSYEYRRAFNKICRRCFRDSSNNRWSRVNFITQELESQTMSTFVNTPFRKDSDQSTQ